MTRIITTRRDLRNYVDEMTSGWYERSDDDIDAIVESILGCPDCPRYGADWTEFLANLPEACFTLLDE